MGESGKAAPEWHWAGRLRENRGRRGAGGVEGRPGRSKDFPGRTSWEGWCPDPELLETWPAGARSIPWQVRAEGRVEAPSMSPL